MKITTERQGDLLEMRIIGRLDNEWAGHLNDTLDASIRQGSHQVVLDLTGVDYVSSAGIGALVRAYKQFQAIHGFFGVGPTSPQVADVIRKTGLASMLLCDIEVVRKSPESSRTVTAPRVRVSTDGRATFELYDLDPNGSVACEVIGDPERLRSAMFREEDCRRVSFPTNSFGLGLGAFGRDFADCSNRMGEFLSVMGSTAQLPTDETGRPDFQVCQGDYTPEVQLGFGIRCRGAFAQLVRFEPAEADGRIPLSVLVDECLGAVQGDLLAFVCVAETAGLIGATLRASPAMGGSVSESRFAHPEIRRWLSFSPERAFARSLAVVVGVACRGAPTGPHRRLAPFLRSLGPNTDLHGHFHAAVFSYQPLKKRVLRLRDTVTSLLENSQLHSVLHLLNDNRDFSGGGESTFLRGACWISPIASVAGADQT